MHVHNALQRQPVTVVHGDAAALEPIPGAHVYCDPPYVGCTPYGWDLARQDVVRTCQRWAEAGAVVAVSEAEPLPLEGWHPIDITLRTGRPEHLTLSRPPARRPGQQLSLLPCAL